MCGAGGGGAGDNQFRGGSAPQLRSRSDRVNGLSVPGSPRTGVGGGPWTPAPSCLANQVIGGHGGYVSNFSPSGALKLVIASDS